MDRRTFLKGAIATPAALALGVSAPALDAVLGEAGCIRFDLGRDSYTMTWLARWNGDEVVYEPISMDEFYAYSDDQ